MKSIKDKILNKIKIDTNTGCWIWQGAKSSNGYPQLWLADKKVRLAHRASYEVFNGELKKGLCICHKCDTPECVNPDHLFQDTIQGNIKDRDSKNRQAQREKNGMAKLNERQIKEIRSLCSIGKKQCDVAKQFNVTHQQISNIVNNLNWRNNNGRDPQGYHDE